MLTGESKLVNKGSGDFIMGGSILYSGQIRMKCTQFVENSSIQSIVKLISEA